MSAIDLLEPEEILLDVKKRLLHTENGETWLLAKDETGELFIEDCRQSEAGGDIHRLSLVEFLGNQADTPAARELKRLLGLMVDDAEATSETS